VLMRSWIAEAGLGRDAAWVPVDSQERDPRRFWISVADALRGTAAGSALVRPLTAAPDLDGWAVVERLLTDLASLEDRLWLVIDDAHLLDPRGVLTQLELLVLRAPPALRFLLATRHDLRLGLHRLRLTGELTEIRAADLRFSLAEPRGLAARLLSDHWLDLYLSGRGATMVELLDGFPRRAVAASPELIAVRVAGDLLGGALQDAGRHLAVATSALPAVPADRRGRLQVLLSVLRLFLARRLNDFPVVVEEAQRLLAIMKTADGAQLGLGEDLHATALISLGIAGIWTLQFEDGERHLTQGVALARQIGRPYPELHGLVHGAHAMLLFRPDASQAEWGRQSIELAERHGWGEEPLAGMACAQLGTVMLYQGRLDEAEPWLERAERILRAEVEPAGGMSLRHARAVLELARGRYREALAAFRGAEKLAMTLVKPHAYLTWTRSLRLQTLVRLGQTGCAGQALAELGHDERASAEMRIAEAALRLASDDPQAAAGALAPVLDGPASGVHRVRMVTAMLLEASARHALGDQVTAGRALERALDITASNGMVLPFLLDPAPALLERHRRYRTAHPALISKILELLSGTTRSAPPPGIQTRWAPGQGLDEQLTDSETRVLRYLPTHLTAHEIAAELHVSVNTAGTHRFHVYAKLGVHSRQEAVSRARALGLLAPSARRERAR
jgi:LuxR family maltose regulon positive regulatory protein